MLYLYVEMNTFCLYLAVFFCATTQDISILYYPNELNGPSLKDWLNAAKHDLEMVKFFTSSKV